MSKNILILCFSFLVFGYSYGQYDWTQGQLILKNGDTLNGYLKLPIINKAAIGNSHAVKYKESKEKNGKSLYYPNSVKEIIFKDLNNETSIYRYIKTSKHGKSQMFKLLYSGDNIRLYGRMVSEVTASPLPGNSNFITSEGYYPTDFNEFYAQGKYERIATPLVKVGPFTKSFKKNAMKYFSDCPNLALKIKNGKLRQSDLLEIAEKYDECK
tara:strand:+ start:63 stop:698 length:636 start_codon:yes stop_codon:yes gene_type:complete